MKLNYKRTLLVGFVFLLICVFWQAYDSIVPKILTDKFGMNQTWSGVIMALDNILALFMLPLFGSISDRCKNKHGRRTPFIVVGTVVAAVALMGLTIADNVQLRNIDSVAKFDDETTLQTIYDYDYSDERELRTPSGETFKVANFSNEEWLSFKSNVTLIARTNVDYTASTITSDAPLRASIVNGDGNIEVAVRCMNGDTVKETYSNKEEWLASDTYAKLTENGKYREMSPYIDYVVPAREAYAWHVTSANPAPLTAFMVILFIVLFAMATFRSPAVALMPDVTIKPLRSKANAVINLMGSLGGVAVLVLGILLGTGKLQNQLMDYTLFFAVITAIMLMALVVFMVKVKEPVFVAEMETQSKALGIEEKDETEHTKKKLSKSELASLLLILASVVLWFMGYNAVSSKYSVYATSVLNMDYNLTIIVGQAAAILAYFPVGIISSKVGRKKTIMAGIIILFVAVVAASFLTSKSSPVLMNILFALCGIGWATINVNSFPMVVELAGGGDVGKYTGFYYTASMAAQTATPILSGFFMDSFGMQTLFPYAAIFVGLAFVTMFFVKHGDSKPIPAKSVIESLDAGD